MAVPPIPTEQLPTAGGREDATVRVHPLQTGSAIAPPGFLQRPSGPLWPLQGLGLHVPRSRWMRIPLPCFLVEHPEAGPFLIDTGIHASVPSDAGPNLGPMRFLLPSLQMTESDAAPAQIQARGVDPAQIELVVMTHLHYDHTSGATQFAKARFLTERREWEGAHAGGARQGFRIAHLDPALAWRAIDVPGEADLFGDGSVRLLHTPGHTKGHLSLVLRLAGGTLLVTGDAAYARRTVDERLVPMLVDDMQDYLASLDRLRELAVQVDHVVTGHDPQGLDRRDDVFE